MNSTHPYGPKGQLQSFDRLRRKSALGLVIPLHRQFERVRETFRLPFNCIA